MADKIPPLMKHEKRVLSHLSYLQIDPDTQTGSQTKPRARNIFPNPSLPTDRRTYVRSRLNIQTAKPNNRQPERQEQSGA